MTALKMPSKRRSSSKKKTKIKNKAHGITFRKPLVLLAAITHPSYRNEASVTEKLEDFDRLEFFGDSILNFVVCRRLYKLFPKADEGMLSRLRSILVSRKILSKIAREINLPGTIRLGKSLVKQKEFLKTKIFADALESFIAAVYFDRGFPAAEKFILKHFKKYFDAKKLFRLDPNPKSTLQELVQRHWQRLPVYVTETLPEGIKTTVSINKQREASAVSRTRREAEEKAARLLIRIIRQELLGGSDKRSSGRKLRKSF